MKHLSDSNRQNAPNRDPSLRRAFAQPASAASRHKWLDRVWLLLLAASLVAALGYLRSGYSCAYLGTDFRGYYASAQIALDHGFSSVYDQELQNATQDALPMRCPNRAPSPALLHVSMPYLPVFVLLFLPLTALDFTASYLLFSILNIAILAAYLVRFSRAFGLRLHAIRLAEWMICLPLLATLSLGQMNIFLLVCLGEFILAHIQGRHLIAGLWLAGMLIKPYTLILLVPGLVVSRQWRVLYGFAAGLFLVLGSSILLAGLEGVAASIEMAFRFAGPLIQTGSSMMNWRAMALNLQAVLPGWAAWGIAVLGMALVAAVSLYGWLRSNQETGSDFLLLMLASLCATFALSWHSHFYLMTLLIPILLILDQQGKLPVSVLAVWTFGLPALYLSVFLIRPDIARNMLGLGYLGLNLYLLAWASRPLPKLSLSWL